MSKTLPAGLWQSIPTNTAPINRVRSRPKRPPQSLPELRAETYTNNISVKNTPKRTSRRSGWFLVLHLVDSLAGNFLALNIIGRCAHDRKAVRGQCATDYCQFVSNKASGWFLAHGRRPKKPLSSNFLHTLRSPISSGLRSAAFGLMPCWAINFNTEAIPGSDGQGLRGIASEMAR